MVRKEVVNNVQVANHATKLPERIPSYIAPVPKPPPNLKVQRAKTIVDGTGIKVLTKCERCGKAKHIVEGQTVCDECRARPNRKRTE